ncbi:MAG: PDZ domain-containing protein [Deltaproteobacteria bacterium]|nr:PDZ domain-containing protein [Deltaproteobacteria bacterium]
MKNHCLWVVIASLLFFSSSCMKRVSPLWVSKVPEISPPPGAEEIIKLPAGEKISFQQLSDDLQGARVIFVGESHDQVEHHQIQVKIIKDLMAKGKEVAIGMEMFEKSQQPILDKWSHGLLTEEDFLKEVQWEKTWSMDYQLYRSILDEAKNHRLKVIALNVHRDLVRKVAQTGIEKLSPEDKTKLPEINLTDKEHLSYIKTIYRDHQGGSAEKFKHFYQAQCLWDEGMAETLAQFLKSPDGAGKTMVVIAGSGHIVFDFGIPKRFYRRTPLPFQTIVLKTWKKNLDEDLSFSGVSEPLADFLWITHPSPFEKKRPRIGVVLKEKEEAKGVLIERVIPGSPAEKAGLLPGDQFVSIDGKEITKLKDIHDAVVQKGRGKEIIIIILRESSEKKISIIIPSAEN